MNTKELVSGWEERIKLIAHVLGITPEVVEQKLKGYGIEQEPMGLEMMDDDEIAKFGDFQGLFGMQEDGHAVPLGKLRLAYKFFKGGQKVENRQGVDARALALQQAFGIKPKLEHADLGKLLEYYDPLKPADPITTTLKQRFGDVPVIAFKLDSTNVDLETTLAFIHELEAHTFGVSPPSTALNKDGRLVMLHCIGEMPFKRVAEDPLFIGKPLVNGRSTVNHFNWTEVKETLRIFCRLAVEMRLVDPNNRSAAMAIFELAIRNSDDLVKVYPEVDLEYRQRAKREDLPKLWLEAGDMNRSNHPFKVGNRKY